jgi:isochorismate pyruvate lyase
MKECQTLEALRTEIDALDDQIVDLIAERNRYIHQASKFKQSVEEIKADERIETVINRVRHRALTEGVSPNLVTELYRKMIDEMVEAEIAEFRNTNTF